MRLSVTDEESLRTQQQTACVCTKLPSLVKIPLQMFIGLVSLRTLDLSHNVVETLDNKTHGLLDDCLSLERVRSSLCVITFSISQRSNMTVLAIFNPLNNKRNLLYIRNESVPRCKHFPPRF